MIKHTNQRVGMLVDVANMYHCAKNLYGSRVNFKEILREGVAGRQLIRAVAYVIQSKTAEEENFFEALSKVGFEVRMKELQVFSGGAKKGDWDVGIAIDGIKMGNKLDAVILVTGDGDYIPLVNYLKDSFGCQVEIMSFEETTSSGLIDAADDFVDMSQDKRKF